MTTPQLASVLQAIFPDVIFHNATPDRLEMRGSGGLNLSVTFDTRPDLSVDYENFSCAPFVYDGHGKRLLGHWFSWPFDHMYMEVTPEKLKRLWIEVNAYAI